MLATDTLTGHLGTLVRYSKSCCYEVSFHIEDGILTVEARLDGVPVALDSNETIKDMVAGGNRIYAKAAWRRQEHGGLVRVR